MKTLTLTLALAVVASLTLVAVSTAQPAPPANLKPGDKAPDFKLQASDGKEYTLAQFKGVKAVAICWFPRAGSQGAKNQCAALEAAMPKLPTDKVQVFGCSTQPLDVTTAFAQQGKYSFPVLSDADRAAATALGCLKPDGTAERWTFLVDDKGVILAIDKSVTPQNQGDELVKALADAGLTQPAAAPTANAANAAPVTLKPGDKAPDFKLQASDGKEYTLAQFAGKSSVALCWTRRAGSGGWKQACDSLTAEWDKLSQSKVQVFMIACSTLKVTQDEMATGKYSFPMLADETQTTAKAYGTMMPGGGGACERWTFLIDDKGVIVAINKSITPAAQGTELKKMLTDAATAAVGAVPQLTTPQLKPGSSFAVQFPEMPPTFADISQGKDDKAQMTVFIPNSYDPNKKCPLFLWLSGGDGGDGGNPGVARGVCANQDFVCVSVPLFRTPDYKPNQAGMSYIITEPDGRAMWPYLKTMLAKLDQLVPNLDPTRQALGGFSNGAHMIAALIDGSDGEATKRFTAFVCAEGGGKLKHYDRLKDKPFLMVSSNSKSAPRAGQICDAAKAAGAKASLLVEDVGKHDFPVSAYPKVGQWLHDVAMQ